MSSEEILGICIMLVCCWGSGAVFYGIGVYFGRKKTPANFWAGSEISPDSVTDIPAYNHANGVMWKQYSLWFWAAGLCSLLGIFIPFVDILSLIVLVLSLFPGFWLLIRRYRKIWKQYEKNT